MKPTVTRDDGPTLAIMHMHTLMACFVLSPNGEESSNKFSGPDPDDLRGPSNGHNTLRKKLSPSEQYLLSNAYGQTDRQAGRQAGRQTDKQTQMHYAHTPPWERGS